MDDQKSKWIQRATAKTNNINVNKTNKLYSLDYALYVINLFSHNKQNAGHVSELIYREMKRKRLLSSPLLVFRQRIKKK
jgi:hypothetical protein